MPSKRSDKTSGEKLLSLYTLLMVRGRREISVTEISATLECSKQTTLRLLNQMEASGYGKLEGPIIKNREHYYRLAILPETKLDIGLKELMQINLCRNMLLQILPKGISSLLGDKDACSPSKSARELTGIAQTYYKGYIDYAPFEKQYSQLLRGIREQKVCIVTYKRSPSAPARTFSFAPMRLVSFRESLSFSGWEVDGSGEAVPKYKNSLSLYLQRCLDVQLTERPFTDLPEPQDAHTDAGPGPFGTIKGECFTVQVLFTPEAAAYVYDRRWSSEQEVSLRDDGSLLLTIKAQSEPEILSWVLSFGAEAKVLVPEWLREDIKKQLAELLKNY